MSHTNRERIGVDAVAGEEERALSTDEIREAIAGMLGVDKARVRIVLGSPFGVAVTVPRREYEAARQASAMTGPEGPGLCEGCEGSGFRGPFGDERCYCAAPDLRDIVRARMVELNGGREKGAQRALAKRLAKPWGLDNWKAAERKLILWFRRGENRTDMTTEPFSVLLDVLGLELRPKED